MEATPALTAKGFFRSLFDFHFVSLIASRFIKFLYACLVVVYSIAYAVLFIAFLARGGGGVAVAILLIPFYFLSLIWLRILMEFLIVIFQIAEDVRTIRMRGGATLGPSAGPVRATISSTPGMTTTAAGWFDAPNDPTRLRYWDGTSWTEHYAPKTGPARPT